MLIAGTIPIEDLPLIMGTVKAEGESLLINGHCVPCTQGTGAMIGAALATTNYLKLEPPQALVVGDIGQGKGSREIYEYLIQKVTTISPEVLALHYCLPDIALTRRLCEAVGKCTKRPIMIADAASMYAAKAAGLASKFDIFTPDATEMAFLADPDATHPAYINRHLFDSDITQTPKLVADAYRKNSAAKLLISSKLLYQTINLLSHHKDIRPSCLELIVKIPFIRLRHICQKYAAALPRNISPDILRGKRKDRSKKHNDGFQNLI